MAEQRGFAYPDIDMVRAFYPILLQRLNAGAPGTIDEARLTTELERCIQMVQHERGDIVRLSGHMMLSLFKTKAFEKHQLQLATALILAFMYRQGLFLALDQSDIVDLVHTVAEGGVYLEDLDQYLRENIRMIDRGEGRG